MKFYVNHSFKKKKKVSCWDVAVYKWFIAWGHLNEDSFDSVIADRICRSLDLPDRLF